MRSLRLVDMKECSAQMATPIEGTCQWILSHGILKDWISDNRSSLLYITGNMGTGKSILVSFLVGEVKSIRSAVTGSDNVTLSWFFCDGKDVNRKDAKPILAGLIFQILEQHLELVERATSKDFLVGSFGTWSLALLWETLRDIMLNPAIGKPFCLKAISKDSSVNIRSFACQVQFSSSLTH
jgi:hypothetical protein